MRSVRLCALGVLVALLLGYPLVGHSATRTSFPQEYYPMRDPIKDRSTGCTAATLNAAITAAGSTQQLLWLSPVDGNTATCTWTLDADVTVPSTLGLWWPQGTQVCPASGKTLTINGPLLGDPTHQIKGTGCAGKIVFGTNTPTVQASWWGGATATALNAAITDIGSAQKTLVIGGPNAWTLSANVTIPANIHVSIPIGARVTIASGQTLTLAACPDIAAAPGWLQPGTTGQIAITDATCTIDVHKYATAGAGTLLSMWTGWEPAIANSLMGKRINFVSGYFSTATPLVYADPDPTNTALTGYVHISGSTTGATYIYWQPTADTAGEFVPATNQSNVKTWLTIGTVGKQTSGVVVENLSILSTDLTYIKRALHFIDHRGLRVQNVSIGFKTGFYDTTGKSIGLHVEGRGQNKISHLPIISADYPLIIDGSPNEGGVCYSTQDGWTGSAGFCEWDTSTIEDVSLEVRRYQFDPGDGKRCVANPNILIGTPTQVHRSTFRQINMNGGSYGVDWAGEPGAGTSGNLWDNITWEDPCPLDPTTIGATRIAAGVSPGVMKTPDPNVYGDNAALQPRSAWGYMFRGDLSAANSYNVQGMSLSNINSLAAGNGLSLHHFNNVSIHNLRMWGNGVITHHYPGFAGIVTAATNANPGEITIAGHGLTLSGTYSITCAAFGGGWTALNTTLTMTITGVDTMTVGVNTSGFGALAGTPHCDIIPAPEPYRPDALDLTGDRVSGPVYPSFPVTCVNCVSGGLTQLEISTDLDLIDTCPFDPLDYISATLGNAFPCTARTMWDSIKDTVPAGSRPGTSTWTPRLLDGSGNEAAYTHRAGVVTVEQVGSSRLLTFSVTMLISSTAGMTGTDGAEIRHTNGDNWGTAYCPLADCNATPYFYSMPVAFATSVNLTAGGMGVGYGSYTSGGTTTGAAGTTCTCTSFNQSCSSTTAQLILSATDTVAGGTPLLISNPGSACTAAPTQCTLGSGTATCSGTATVSTTLLRPNFTMMTADVPGGDQRIILRAFGSGQGQQQVTVNKISAGTYIAISGSFVLQ